MNKQEKIVTFKNIRLKIRQIQKTLEQEDLIVLVSFCRYTYVYLKRLLVEK